MNYYLGIDIGGSWLKAIAIEVNEGETPQNLVKRSLFSSVVRVESRLSAGESSDTFIKAIEHLFDKMNISYKEIAGVGVSTAGVVDYHGSKLLLCAPHLAPLQSSKWIEYLKEKTESPVVLINDADAAAIGAAACGYLQGEKTYGVMPVGTGLGFTVVRNGRRWMPHYSLPLLGSVYSPYGCYDNLGSASLLSQKIESGKLEDIFLDGDHLKIKEQYLKDLVGIISSSQILYGTDEILLGGGLVDAAVSFHFADALEKEINSLLADRVLNPGSNVTVRLLKEGNLLPLLGALLLSVGESRSSAFKRMRSYHQIKTERAYDSTLHLDKMAPLAILKLLNKMELEAADNLSKVMPKLSKVVGLVAERLRLGGRLIYLGCGTSGRLAAVDAVELPCTFGFPRDKVLALIAGGIADAAIDIETNFEEDASSVPDLLIANLDKRDVVVGISVSGSAYYVNSGLGYAHSLGALTVMIQEAEATTLPFADYVLPLYTGSELIAGSTRMKAGTATKKLLNFLSTAVMIRLGKVTGTYMTELECINDKLIQRAIHILSDLYGLTKEEAFDLLKKHDFKLNDVIRFLR